MPSCIPFEKSGMLDLYEPIKNNEVKIPAHCNHDLRDLLGRLLEKDPSRRIEMDEIRAGVLLIASYSNCNRSTLG